MTNQFKLPDLGEGLHEAEITELMVKKGDVVKEGDPLMVVETDKASVEIPSPYSGVISEIHIAAGEIAEVGTVLITFNSEDEQKPTISADKQSKETETQITQAIIGQDISSRANHTIQENQKLPVAASPATRQLARELKVDIKLVTGSGPAGRVTNEDVKRFAQTALSSQDLGKQIAPTGENVETTSATGTKPQNIPKKKAEQILPSLISPEDLELPDFSTWGETQQIPLRSIRRAIAKKMTASWTQIPHVSHHDDADITDLEKLRKELKAEVEGGLTLTVFLIKAVVATLKKYPNVNASLDIDNEMIIQKHFYNIGIATDTDRGLIVPVIHDADRKNITQLSKELSELIKRTREDKNTLEDLQRGTFTITNAGVLGGTHFSPIIYYPQVAILGASRARWQPVVRNDEYNRMEIVPRYILPLVITFDHRVLDGGDGARFLSTVIELLEKPEKMLLSI